MKEEIHPETNLISSIRLIKGDIVQIDPDTQFETYRGCLMVVKEIIEEDLVGFVMIPDSRGSQVLTLTIPLEEVERVGKAAWLPQLD